MQSMHEYTPETDTLTGAVVDYTRRRIAHPQPLDHPVPPEDLTRSAGPTITPDGIGGREALRIWEEVLAPATITTDHPSFLAFVPGAPSKASVLFDLAVSASEVYGGSWLEGGGAVWAENQVLGWLAELPGCPGAPVAVSCRGGRRGTCRPWSRRATPRAMLGAGNARRAGRSPAPTRCIRRSRRRRG
jgi:L-2,4-diaminobutyrate decarboxylase